MFRTGILAALVLVGSVGALDAQFPRRPLPPFPQQIPPIPPASPVDGQWFFRGDRFQPCYIQTIPGPGGPRVIVTNEKGSQTEGWLNRSGTRLTIPEWNIIGTLRGDALVWPNGDFWGR